MTPNVWHVEDAAVGRYVGGEAGSVERHSIEAHFMSCGECRSMVNAASLARAAGADRWDRVAEAIERPGVLRRAVPDLARLSWATPALAATTAAVVVALVIAVVFGALDRSPILFVGLLSVAPIVPIGLVIVAFRPSYDPAGSLSEATPLAGGRLAFVRSLVCSGIALAASALVCWAFPLPSPLLAAWLVPAVLFAAFMLAASTWFDPLRVGAGLTTGWWVVVGSWFGETRRLPIQSALDRFALARADFQVVALAAACLAGAVAWGRRDARPDWRAL